MSTLNNELWEEIYEMLEKSNKKIVVNMSDKGKGKNTLDRLQVTSNSVLGSIAYNTTGIIVDNWVRILGADSEKNRGLLSYNEMNELGIANKIEKMLIIADDVVGGVFALNAGRFSEGVGDVWYFAPDTLEWESLEFKYAEFLAWAVNGDIHEFYSDMRWKAWEKDVKNVQFDEAILIYPFLWSNEVQLETAEKKVVPVDELLNINKEYSEKFKLNL
ncbi:DUF2625 family protein [Peribacillus sp. NPDC097295]|uniref:DUF2625 family protein n=1 Tax=Peribacillus sp. NPDC097295 TaxID=3364402 RepID=UPI0038039B37